MPRPNMISGNYNYLGVGGHYKSGLAGLGSVSQGELDNAGLTISEWQSMLGSRNYGSGLNGINGIGETYVLPYPPVDMNSPIGPGIADYMAGVQTFQENYANRKMGIVNWVQDNWMMLVAGAGLAMILLPKGRR